MIAIPNLRQWVRRLHRPAWLGTLRRTTPLSASWGYDRGTPVERYYIENFLDEHRQDICGRMLEIRGRPAGHYLCMSSRCRTHIIRPLLPSRQ